MKKEMDVSYEIEKLKAEVNKLRRHCHSNTKYIKYLFAKLDEVKKNGVGNASERKDVS